MLSQTKLTHLFVGDLDTGRKVLGEEVAVDGATQADRQHLLALASRQLRERGFRQMKAGSLQEKHVVVLLRLWQAESLSPTTDSARQWV